ncbi:MAG: hypothetical protein CPSOU_4937 [uncultured Paraburkholderia sp.]|nr:MAG: hypothetical protein CPSOU_4937 [uncultured Paraburkholderia sp.]
MAGLSLSTDGTAESISTASAAKTAGYIYLQLDTTTAVRLNTLYAGGSTRVSVSSATRSDYSWGYGSYTIMYNGSIKNLSATVSGNNIIVGFDGVAKVVYNGCDGTRSRTQIDMIKIIGNMGDSFYLPVTVKTGPWATSARHTAQCVVSKTTKKFIFSPRKIIWKMVGTSLTMPLPIQIPRLLSRLRKILPDYGRPLTTGWPL